MSNEDKAPVASPTVPYAGSGVTRRAFIKANAAAAGVGALGVPLFVRADERPPISLPPAKTDGKVSIEAALKQRRSERNFASSPLTVAEVGQLCWAAQGVTSTDRHRTAPSARAIYPLELYVAAGSVTGLSAGFYHYRPANHSLELVEAVDKRADLDQKAVSQSWNPIAKAPSVFVISGNVAKMAESTDPLVHERAAEFTWVEAGLAAQGFFLEATAMGLGSVYTGGFRPKEAHAVLGLPPSEEVLGILPVGRRM
ncbi:MAG TPA: SagB/ThcOx family dehydrogenase [Burkholderiaceae bacterium]|nr:SagB/ThcOx family dehydrogenase [Burkholderiaceae bacterium]